MNRRKKRDEIGIPEKKTYKNKSIAKEKESDEEKEIEKEKARKRLRLS